MLNIIPQRRPRHMIILENPMEVRRNKNESTIVKRGSVKIIVKASPSGMYCKQAKLKYSLSAPNKAWKMIQNLTFVDVGLVDLLLYVDAVTMSPRKIA